MSLYHYHYGIRLMRYHYSFLLSPSREPRYVLESFVITFYVENRATRCERIYLGMGNPLKVVATLVSYIAVGFGNSISRVVRLSIAQLVERRTVDEKIAILRSLVRIRFGRTFFLATSSFS